MTGPPVKLPPLRSLLPLCAAALAAAAALPASAAATHTGSHVLPAYGINSFWAEGIADLSLGLTDMDLMGAADIGLYRARFRQDKVLSGGTYSNWAQLDNLALQAANRGVTLVPVVINLPGEVYTPPKTKAVRQEFASFVAAAARRYGSQGSFWQTCGCPKRPALVWEVWNESNFSLYWNAPNPTEYGLLLAAVSAKVRKADRSARVMFGGLGYASSYNGTTSLEPNAFLRNAIAAAGASSFDALALHSYHGNATSGVNAIGNTVSTLRAAGATWQQVWVNEFGRTTRLDDPATTSVNEQETSEAAQETWLKTFLNNLYLHSSDWKLGPVFWYALRDSHLSQDPRLGLRRTNPDNTDGGAKPAWTEYTTRSDGAALLDLPVRR